MAAVASSSRLAVPRPPQRSRKQDVFKPRFPLDPFAGAPTALGEPWFLKVDAILAATAHQRRNVFFVLGGASHVPPTLKELAPLFQSRHLANSLVILATHNPPDIPHIVLPTVRILHLTGPLALEDAGAVRFVNVLEWAERIARTWRKHGGAGVLELSEELDIHGELAPPNVLRFSGSQSTPASPGSSSTQLSSESLPSRPSSLFRPLSSASGRVARSRQTSQSLPRPDPSQRPFDALINFLPDHVSDKALLKNSILVTTISRPFLVSNGPSAPTARPRTGSTSSTSSTSRFPRPQSFFGTFTRSSSSVYLSATPSSQSGDSLNLPSTLPLPPAKALILHLVPPAPAHTPLAARRKLVESMEAFLVSFALQAVSGTGGEAMERARPYVMQAATFCEAVGCEPGVVDWGDWTVADIVLSGALDADSPSAAGTNVAAAGSYTTSSIGKARGAASNSKASRRAWIAAAADIVVMPSPEELPPPRLTPDTRARTDSLIVAQQHQRRSQSEGGRTASSPLPTSLSAPVQMQSQDWGPEARTLSHSRTHLSMSATHSFSSALSRQRSPVGSSSLNPSHGAAAGSDGLPTPPHSEESACTSSVSSSGTGTGERALRSAGSSVSEEKKTKKQHGGWRFWRRLSHIPAAIRA
ncbi:hypothetical protein BC628DRAFT_1316388 [Trametes gibbosa]|nr:hypothetical protein BC628DRAFT_1316388 [Trametes gibbosa]